MLSGNKTSAGRSAAIGVKAKPSPLVGLHTGLDVTSVWLSAGYADAGNEDGIKQTELVAGRIDPLNAIKKIQILLY